MKLRRFWQGLLFTAFSLSGLAAHAGLILTLDDGVNDPISVSDIDGDGLVTYYGDIGSWTINTTTGATNPAVGSEYVDKMHLHSFNVTGGNGGTLTLTLERTGLDATSAGWATHLGGVTDGTIDFTTLLNGVAISHYFASTSWFSDGDSGHINELAPYSLTLVATINHAEAGDTSFNYRIQVPEPSVLALLGSGLLLTGWAGMRRRRQAAR